MNTFYLRVVSSDKVFFEDKVTRFVLPLEDGEMGILAHHENMVIATSIGEIRITTADGRTQLWMLRLPPSSCSRSDSDNGPQRRRRSAYTDGA